MLRTLGSLSCSEEHYQFIYSLLREPNIKIAIRRNELQNFIIQAVFPNEETYNPVRSQQALELYWLHFNKIENDTFQPLILHSFLVLICFEKQSEFLSHLKQAIGVILKIAEYKMQWSEFTDGIKLEFSQFILSMERGNDFSKTEMNMLKNSVNLLFSKFSSGGV